MVCLGSLFLGAGSARGAEHVCASIAGADQRLACYDREYPPVVAAPSAAPSAAEAQHQFGLSGREVELRKPESERALQIDRIEASVALVRPLQGGQREVVLDNGQVWRVTEGGSRGPLSAGDAVSVRRTFAGGYLLSKPGGIGLRVRRLR